VNRRIFDGSGLNLVHGHYGGYTGTALYGSNWISDYSPASSSFVSPNTNWAVVCGTNSSSPTFPNNFLVNGTPRGTANGGSGVVVRLTINNGIGASAGSPETSDFAFQQVIIWDSALTSTQMQTISSLVVNYMSSGKITYPWLNGPIFPPPPPPPCFKQGIKILKFDPITNTESYVPVETLRKGDLIKTFTSGYKPISHIGWKTLDNPADAPDVRNRLYGLSPKEINPDSEIDEPLYLTGRHSILRNDLTESDLNILRKYMGDVYVTENHYRVPIFLDERAKPYTDHNPVIIWHFALENPDIHNNYGVRANGILVESSSIEYMTDHSNMELVD
jgi:hypothetical protein